MLLALSWGKMVEITVSHPRVPTLVCVGVHTYVFLLELYRRKKGTLIISVLL